MRERAGDLADPELVIAAVERHLRDLEEGHSRGLVREAAKARHAIEFFLACPSITTGAIVGRPF